MVSAEQAETIRQLYEPLIESLEKDTDSQAFAKLCENVEQMLMRVNWRQHLQKMREEMSKQTGGQALPLAEILIQAQSSQVIDAMNQINELARANHLRSAMDAAFQALTYAPTYLPLHTLIGELAHSGKAAFPKQLPSSTPLPAPTAFAAKQRRPPTCSGASSGSRQWI